MNSQGVKKGQEGQDENQKNRFSIRRSKKEKPTSKVKTTGREVPVSYKRVQKDNLSNLTSQQNIVLQANKSGFQSIRLEKK